MTSAPACVGARHQVGAHRAPLSLFLTRTYQPLDVKAPAATPRQGVAMQAGDANGCQISSVVILLSQMEVSSCAGVVVVANPVVQSLLSELYPLMFVGSPVQPIWSAVWVPGERYY